MQSRNKRAARRQMFRNRPLRTAATAAQHLSEDQHSPIRGRIAETAGTKKRRLSVISYRHGWWISLPFAYRQGGHLLPEFKIILGSTRKLIRRAVVYDALLKRGRRSDRQTKQIRREPA